MPAAGVVPSVIIYAKDPDGLAAFYSAVLGMRETERTEGFVTLAAASHSLVIVRMREEIAATVEISSPPRRRENVALKPVFPVDDVLDASAAAAANGGTVDPKNRPWTFQGAVRIDCLDPEGNVIQLAAPASASASAAAG